MRALCVVGLGVALAELGGGTVRAQESKETKAIVAELDQFRNDLFQAFNKEEYKEMLENYVHKDVIATWQDGTTSKGHAEVLAEFDKLKKIIAKMTVHPATDKRLILNDGKLVIASGPLDDDYDLRRGDKVNLHSRWEATLIRENDRWLLVAFSASTNAFDNEVVDLYLRQANYVGAGIAGPIGLLIGIVATWLLVRRPR